MTTIHVSLFDQNAVHRGSSPLVFFKNPPLALIVVTFSFRIGQAQHALGELVQQFLRTHRILARRIFSDVAVQFFVVVANLLRIVLELREAQQRVVIERSWFLNAEPVLVDINCHRNSLPVGSCFQTPPTRRPAAMTEITEARDDRASVCIS